ncbi:thioesterase [Desulfonema ishimotonii]|uniref:Acyl-coenzyme A thioesterase THEM4 n=1 Tax=Desulfonema ishimotonii TaxID=45657 RepID=A0A401FTF9_9BACT|nr:PaaI family thioesterase [Desulfonema ishimotonii]GBC60267.1 thioesterase [Desulfonema ishimotonii]
MEKLPRYSECFICGRDNPAGTDITFIRTEEGVACEYLAAPKHNGYRGIIHGGIISALLDECVGWAVSLRAGRMCVTGELTIRFRKSLPVSTKVTVKGFCDPEQKTRRLFRGYGHIEDEAGTVYAKAEGRFFPMSEEAQKPVFECLKMADAPEKAVTPADIWGEDCRK